MSLLIYIYLFIYFFKKIPSPRPPHCHSHTAVLMRSVPKRMQCKGEFLLLVFVSQLVLLQQFNFNCFFSSHPPIVTASASLCIVSHFDGSKNVIFLPECTQPVTSEWKISMRKLFIVMCCIQPIWRKASMTK